MEQEESETPVLPNFKDVNDFTQQASRAVVQAVRASHSLPTSGDDYDYYQSFDAFRRLMEMESARILELMQQIMRYHGIKGNLSSNSLAREIEDKFDILVDANDQLLERAGSFLDEAAGVKKEAPLIMATMTPKSNLQAAASWNRKVGQLKSVAGNKSASFRLLSAKNIQRPQLKFKEKVDNSHNPFIPKIKEKPNALKTLEESFTQLSGEDLNIDENYTYPHPYQYELDHFTPNKRQLAKTTPQTPCQESSQATMITTEEALVELCKTLKKETEIAVDLEHHSYRSFLGITCLMQISTRKQDYLLDTLELRSEMHLLLDVFTDPAIVKVFHGAESDVDWLQRDLGLYVVNMFDTGQASRVLGFARHSLSYLLMHYCKVEANKQFQLADWRIRPLPEELIKYAQEDTHHLLYIYDLMKNELLERGNNKQNLLQSVIHRSTQTCSKKYKKYQFTDANHIEMYKKSKKLFNSQQIEALKGIYEWRDKIARADDESTGYVLPNHMLLQIAELLPREPQGILACCNPIPPLVRQNLNEIHTIIKYAREQPLYKVTPSRPVLKPSKLQHPKYSVDSLLHCPHDLSRQKNEPAEAVKLDFDSKLVATESSMFKDSSGKPPIIIKESPIIIFFGWNEKPTSATSLTDLTPGQEKAKRIKALFKDPFEKFLPLKKGEALPMNTTDIIKLGSDQSLDKWRLLPATVFKPKEDASKSADKADIDTTVNTGHEDSIKFSKEEEEAQPLRYMLPKKKIFNEDGTESYPLPAWDKRVSITASSKDFKSGGQQSTTNFPQKNKDSDNKSKSHSNTDNGGESSFSSFKSRKRKSEEPESGTSDGIALESGGEFKAHDYSSTDYNKLFDEGTTLLHKARGRGRGRGRGNRGNRGGHKPRDYDPDNQNSDSNFKHGKKPKLSSADSKKSITYTKGRGQAPKINWPKR